MTIRPSFLQSDNLSHAWVAAFRSLMESGVTSLQPLVVVVTGFADDGLPHEDHVVRQSLEATSGDAVVSLAPPARRARSAR